MPLNLATLMNVLGIDEQDVVYACLSYFSPVQPSVLRGNWERRPDRYGADLPTTEQFARLFEQAGYKCALCETRGQLTVDHIDKNPKNNDIDNLRVLCRPCNRTRGIADPVADQQAKVLSAAYEMWEESGNFPKNVDVTERTGITNIGGATYKLKWLSYLVNSLPKPQNRADEAGTPEAEDAVVAFVLHTDQDEPPGKPQTIK